MVFLHLPLYISPSLLCVGEICTNSGIVIGRRCRKHGEKKTLLDECRTLWGEPERVHAGAACVNVHGAVACACHQNVSLTES